MKLGDDEDLIDVRTCTEDDDIMISSRMGKAIRFKLSDIRVFAGRASTGVRGIKLAKGDEVVSVSIVKHRGYTPEQRTAYLKMASRLRSMDDEVDTSDVDESIMPADLFEQMAADEEFVLTVTSKGFGKRTSAYEYRTAGRGGQGIANMKLTSKNGEIVASFRVEDTDQIMMVTDGGQLIRMPVENIRFVGRQTQGVTLFKVANDETVVSVAMIREDDEDEDEALEVAEGEETIAEEAEAAAEEAVEEIVDNKGDDA